MAVIGGTIGRIVHDTSTALIENQIATKISDAVTGFVSSGFQVADDVLKIAQDLSKPEEEGAEEPEETEETEDS